MICLWRSIFYLFRLWVCSRYIDLYIRNWRDECLVWKKDFFVKLFLCMWRLNGFFFFIEVLIVKYGEVFCEELYCWVKRMLYVIRCMRYVMNGSILIFGICFVFVVVGWGGWGVWDCFFLLKMEDGWDFIWKVFYCCNFILFLFSFIFCIFGLKGSLIVSRWE